MYMHMYVVHMCIRSCACVLYGMCTQVSLSAAACREAMAQHASQRVWYRRLYMRCSRYCFVNTLERM